jgi:hypothetical protein
VKGVTGAVALVLACAERQGRPLDPRAFDDAAVLLRAEDLLEDGLAVEDALAQALGELEVSRRDPQ